MYSITMGLCFLALLLLPFEQGFAFHPAAKQQDSKKGINDGRFDLDEFFIVKIDSERAKADHQYGGKPQHGRYFTQFPFGHDDSNHNRDHESNCPLNGGGSLAEPCA